MPSSPGSGLVVFFPPRAWSSLSLAQPPRAPKVLFLSKHFTLQQPETAAQLGDGCAQQHCLHEPLSVNCTVTGALTHKQTV